LILKAIKKISVTSKYPPFIEEVFISQDMREVIDNEKQILLCLKNVAYNSKRQFPINAEGLQIIHQELESLNENLQ
jgi:hypothetical protein